MYAEVKGPMLVKASTLGLLGEEYNKMGKLLQKHGGFFETAKFKPDGMPILDGRPHGIYSPVASEADANKVAPYCFPFVYFSSFQQSGRAFLILNVRPSSRLHRNEPPRMG